MTRKVRTDIPWEQQDGEGTRAFEAFQTYRDMGAERSLVKVARKLGKSSTIVERWSRLWDWVNRVREYDREMDRQAHEQAVKSVRKMTERHVTIAMQLQAKALKALNKLDDEDLGAKMVLEYLMRATELERISRYLQNDEAANSEDEMPQIVIERTAGATQNDGSRC